MAAMAAFGVMMNKVDKQALREAAVNAKTAGEAPVMSFDQRISAINAFTNFLTPAMVISLLDENEALAAENYRMKVAITQQIKLKTKIKNSGMPPHPDFWIQSICEAEDNVLRAISEATETYAFINEMQAQGVERCAAWIQGGYKYSRMAEMLREFAAKLREGKV